MTHFMPGWNDLKQTESEAIRINHELCLGSHQSFGSSRRPRDRSMKGSHEAFGGS